jgi:hypothetical protein
MAKTSVTPWSSVSATTVTGVKVYPLGLTSNFAVTEDISGTTAIKNVASDVDLEEKITIRYQELNKVSASVTEVNPRSTKAGYQFVIKDDYVVRTTESTTGAVTDDPVTVYLTVRTTKGNPALQSGNDVLAALERLLAAVIDINSSDAVASTQTTLDRLMRGATKPSALV